MKGRPWHFHPAAEKELLATAVQYEEARIGVGDAFIDAVNEKLALAARFASPGTTIAGSDASLRRVFLVPRYPYSLVLEIEDRVVLAVAHLRRRPNYRKRRLKRSSKSRASWSLAGLMAATTHAARAPTHRAAVARTQATRRAPITVQRPKRTFTGSPKARASLMRSVLGGFRCPATAAA